MVPDWIPTVVSFATFAHVNSSNARVLLVERVAAESKVTSEFNICAGITVVNSPSYAVGSVKRHARIGESENVKLKPSKLVPKRGLHYGRERCELHNRHDIGCGERRPSRRVSVSFRSPSWWWSSSKGEERPLPPMGDLKELPVRARRFEAGYLIEPLSASLDNYRHKLYCPTRLFSSFSSQKRITHVYGVPNTQSLRKCYTL